MNLKKRSGILAAALLSVFTASTALAQNVAINTDGSRANPNAILDIKSADKGLLIPRLTTEARMRIAPTQGLIVYDTETNSFWYHTGKAWQNIAAITVGPVGFWDLTGNAGTIDGTNFLGTTDNVPLNIRVNNFQSGRIDPTLFNTFWGYRSGFLGPVGPSGHDNTGLGSHALFHLTSGFNNTGVGSNALMSNTTGWHNTALGRLCLQANTSGINNTAIGTAALQNSTTSSNNTAIGAAAMMNNIASNNIAVGASAMQNNTTGSRNVAVGMESLLLNLTGTQNTAVGFNALRVNTANNNTAIGNSVLQANTTGIQNTGQGSNVLFFNTTGFNNTASGVGALGNNTTGSQNTAFGFMGLTLNTTGTSNTALGNVATVSAGNLTNATAIGAGAVVNASNKIRLGNGAVTVIEGQVPFTFPSDGRFKFDVQEDVKGLEFIMQLRPVTYHFDTKRFDASVSSIQLNDPVLDESYAKASLIRRSGFIAQEVEDAAKKSGYDFSGIIAPGKEQQHYSLSYDAFVVPLVKGMQEQQKTIDHQQKEMQDQRQVIDEQNKKISELQRQLDEIKKLLTNSK